VKAFFDTSVLIAVFYANHQFHRPSIDLFLQYKKNEACCGVHSLAEIYSVLTGRSGRDRVGGHEAMLFLGDVQERLTVVSLDGEEYYSALKDFSALGITGGAIYDALLGQCALKSKAQIIYTWNKKDFLRLGDAITARTRTPSAA